MRDCEQGIRDEICQNEKCRYNTVGNVVLTQGPQFTTQELIYQISHTLHSWQLKLAKPNRRLPPPSPGQRKNQNLRSRKK